MSVCKTKHSKQEESTVVGPCTRVEPASGYRHQHDLFVRFLNKFLN